MRLRHDVKITLAVVPVFAVIALMVALGNWLGWWSVIPTLPP